MPSAPGSTRSIEVEQVVAGTPEQLWSMVADVTRIGEWSPEATSGEWIGGTTGATSGSVEAAVGARFRGKNQNGSKSWTTSCVVTICEPGARFGFDVRAMGLKVAQWSYTFDRVDGGCRVTERWEDQRGVFLTRFSPLVTGTKDRVERNRETMTETLRRLAAAVEQ